MEIWAALKCCFHSLDNSLFLFTGAGGCALKTYSLGNRKTFLHEEFPWKELGGI